MNNFILNPQRPLKIVYFHRKRGSGHYSLERVFSVIRQHLRSDTFQVIVAECPRESKGIINRIINMLWAARHPGDINHITGDVHYLSLLLKKNKTILTIHDCNVLRRSQGLRKFLLWLFWYLLPASRCQLITAISEFTKKELINFLKCSPSKIIVIHDPYGNDFKPFTKPFNQNCPVILQIGTGWNKNLERVAEALKGIPCTLKIVGPLSEKQKSILAKNKILYENHVDVSNEELVSLYQQSDLVIFASLYEGFGLPIVEAQATGRPVITSCCCSMPEVAGDGACFVEPMSVDSIREGILRVINDNAYRQELIQKGFENVRRFSPEYIAVKYLELYKELIHGNSSFH